MNFHYIGPDMTQAMPRHMGINLDAVAAWTFWYNPGFNEKPGKANAKLRVYLIGGGSLDYEKEMAEALQSILMDRAEGAE